MQGQGAFETTDNATDLAIDGTGLFILKDAEGGTFYTRAGQFHFNNDGKLVTPDGYTVQGWDLRHHENMSGLPEDIDVSKLHNILWKETSDVKLAELDENFYFEIRKKLKALREQNKTEPTPITSQKLEQVEVPVRDLISARLSKMVKMALKDVHPSLTGTMVSEELWLYERLAKLIRDWSSMIF